MPVNIICIIYLYMKTYTQNIYNQYRYHLIINIYNLDIILSYHCEHCSGCSAALSRFPPTIFYKIYTHGNVVDLGSFAPREYYLERLSQEQGNILPGSTVNLLFTALHCSSLLFTALHSPSPV